MVLSNQLYVELLKMTSRGLFQPHLACDSNTYTWKYQQKANLSASLLIIKMAKFKRQIFFYLFSEKLGIKSL